jgi:hypothetical protein
MIEPDYTSTPVRKWVEESDERDIDLEFKRTLITGELADRVRERFGATDEPVYFVEYQEESGGCHTCYSIDNYLRVECGNRTRDFSAYEGLPLNSLLDWFDEPRRQAEREATERARRAQQAANDHAFTSTIVDGIAGAIGELEAEGYSSDQEWHDKLMTRLGMNGYRT